MMMMNDDDGDDDDIDDDDDDDDDGDDDDYDDDDDYSPNMSAKRIGVLTYFYIWTMTHRSEPPFPRDTIPGARWCPSLGARWCPGAR